MNKIPNGNMDAIRGLSPSVKPEETVLNQAKHAAKQA